MTQSGRSSDRDALIERHMSYVRKVATDILRKAPPSLEFEDLVAYGNLGLVRAAEKYNPARGVSFVTFAHYYIQGAIWDGIRKTTDFTRSGGGRWRLEANAADYFQALAEETTGELGFGTSVDEEIAEARAQLEGLLPVYVLSLEGENLNIADENSLSFAESLERDDLAARLMELVATLPAEDRATIEALYVRGLSATEYAAELGLSRSWGSRLHARAIRRLREEMVRVGWLTAEVALER